MDKHGVIEDQVVAAIEGMADPVLVFDSATASDGLVALVEVPGESRPVADAVHLNE